MKSQLLFSKFVVALVVSLFVQVATAAVTVTATDTATVDHNSLNPDDTLTYTITAESNDEVSVGQPSLPGLNDFDLINQWFDQVSEAGAVMGPNGPQFKRTKRYSFHFMLQPKREGTLNIGAAEVVVDGKVHYTKPISIRVAPGAGVQAPQRQRQQRPGAGGAFPPPGFEEEEDDLFNQLLRRMPPGMNPGAGADPRGGSRNLPINPNEAFFVQAELKRE